MESLEALRGRLARAKIFAETGGTRELREAFRGVVHRLAAQLERREGARPKNADPANDVAEAAASADEWRSYAESVRNLAATMHLDGAKAPLLSIAEHWERLAAALEKSSK